MTQKPPKTYKRETALVMLVLLGASHLWGVFDERAADMAVYLTMPIFMFAGAAFGLDAYAKQVQR